MTATLPTITMPSEAELQVRLDLAACYRLAAMYGWDDLVSTHLSVRVPGEETFLINPFGLLFEEITPASLVKVDMDGNILDDSPYKVNQAGFVIHSAVHAARPDVACVMHLHTRDGVAVSALEAGLLPLNQTAMFMSGGIAFHEYEGVALDLAERQRLADDLGDAMVMLLRNHGTLAVGRSIAECFTLMYHLERSCTIQVRTLGMGGPLHQPSPDAVAKVVGLGNNIGPMAEAVVWPALLRKLDRDDPTWRD
jgi:ribulose-5-phosphate 4-epimerase/fuculose-1-phosphate aldolase